MDNQGKVSVSARLKQIMQERHLKQADILRMVAPLCEMYGEKIGSNALSEWVTGKYEPNQRKLTILGQALGVSEAWLMGFNVPKERNVQTDPWMKAFRESLRQEYGKYDETELRMAGIDPYRLEEIVDGTKPITLSEACELADQFGCSLDEMVGYQNIIRVPEEQVERITQFVNLFSKLSNTEQDMVIASMEGLLSRKNSSED